MQSPNEIQLPPSLTESVPMARNVMPRGVDCYSTGALQITITNAYYAGLRDAFAGSGMLLLLACMFALGLRFLGRHFFFPPNIQRATK